MFPPLDMTSSFLFNLLLSIRNEVICFLNLVTNYGKKQSVCVDGRKMLNFISTRKMFSGNHWHTFVTHGRARYTACVAITLLKRSVVQGTMSNCRMKLSYTSCEFLFISVQPKHTLGQVQFHQKNTTYMRMSEVFTQCNW